MTKWITWFLRPDRLFFSAMVALFFFAVYLLGSDYAQLCASGPSPTWAVKSDCFKNYGSIGSFLLSTSGISLAVAILFLQRRDSKQLEEALIEEPTSEDQVVYQVIELLERAESDPDSHLYFMAYWTWFGVDIHFPRKLHTVDSIQQDCSRIAQLLKSRIAKDLKTTIVVTDDVNYLNRFVREVLEHRLDSTKPLFRPKVTDENVSALVNRYLKDLDILERMVDHAGNSGGHVSLKKRSDIPSLIFVEQSRRPRAIYYLGELAAVARKAPLGGFIARNRNTVHILATQVSVMTKDGTEKAA